MTWPSALSNTALFALGQCDKDLVLRRLVEECATSDPRPREADLEALLDELQTERARITEAEREAELLRREKEARDTLEIQSVWESVAAEVLTELAAGHGGLVGLVEEALEELKEEEEEERRWAEEDADATKRANEQEVRWQESREAKGREREAARAERDRNTAQRLADAASRMADEERAWKAEQEATRQKKRRAHELQLRQEVSAALEEDERRRRMQEDPLSLGSNGREARSAEEQLVFDQQLEQTVTEALQHWDAIAEKEREEKEKSWLEQKEDIKTVREAEMQEEARIKAIEDEQDGLEDDAERRHRQDMEQEREERRETRLREREARLEARKRQRQLALLEEAGDMDADDTGTSSDIKPHTPDLPGLLQEQYDTIFGAIATTPLHALCRNPSINESLLISLVVGTRKMPVLLRGQRWEGGGLSELMARGACKVDSGRLPLHAAVNNGSCPASCVATVMREYPDAVWHKDDLGLTPLALACMTHPNPSPAFDRSTGDESASGLAPRREARGERIQRWRGQGGGCYSSAVKEKDHRDTGGPGSELGRAGGEGRESDALEGGGCALHLKLDTLLCGFESHGSEDRGQDDGSSVHGSVTGSAASMTQKLVSDALAEAERQSVELAVTPSGCSSLSARSAAPADVMQDRWGCSQDSTTDQRFFAQRRMRLAVSWAAESGRLPLHLLCANHAITLKACDPPSSPPQLKRKFRRNPS